MDKVESWVLFPLQLQCPFPGCLIIVSLRHGLRFVNFYTAFLSSVFLLQAVWEFGISWHLVPMVFIDQCAMITNDVAQVYFKVHNFFASNWGSFLVGYAHPKMGHHNKMLSNAIVRELLQNKERWQLAHCHSGMFCRSFSRPPVMVADLDWKHPYACWMSSQPPCVSISLSVTQVHQ